MVTGKHVGTEIASSDGVTGSELDSGPPGSVQESAALQPVRNGLLAYADAFAIRRWVRAKKLSNASGKRRLAPGDVNRPLKGSNVVSIHATSVTRNLVRVNKDVCLTDEKVSCTVLTMTTAKKKPAKASGNHAPPARKTAPIVGPDGFTMGQRVLRLMAEQGMSQTGLADACSKYYAAFIKDEPDRVKQQHIFNIVQGQDSSWVVPLIAAVFEVSPLWLQLGIGKREIHKH
jgi:hypothetical protein